MNGFKKAAMNIKKVTAKTVEGIAGATVAAVAFTAKAVEAASEYETQMQNVATLLDGTSEEIKARTAELGKDIIDVSNATGASTADLTDGMYQVISAFGDTEDAVKILETASKAAVAGNATTTDSINLLSAVTKGYGDTSAEAQQKAADLAFQTVKLGQTSFPELAASMGKVIPLAATMGVKQEELFGAMATLTGVTGGTAEVTTQLRGAVQGFLQPTKEMAAAMKELGYADGQAMIESLGLQGSLDALKDSVGGNEIAFAKLFGSVEAKNAVLALTGAQAENFTEKTKAMYAASGMTEAAFMRQTDSFEYSMKMLKNLGKNFMTEVGQKILPNVRILANGALPLLTDAIDQLMPLFDEILASIDFEMIGNLGKDIIPAVVSAIQSLVPILSDVFPILNDVISSVLPVVLELLSQLTPVLNQIISTILPIVADLLKQVLPIAIEIIRGVLPIAITLIQALLPIIQALMPIINIVLGVLQQLLPPIMQILNLLNPLITALGSYIVGAINRLTPIIQFLASILTGKLGAAFQTLQPIIDAAIRVFAGLIDFITNVFSGNWSAAWQSVVDIFGGIWDGMKARFVAPINFIIRVLNYLISKINTISFDLPDWKILGEYAGAHIGFNLSQIPEVALAQGGIVTGPTTALVGEGSEPEAVLPLSKLADLIDVPDKTPQVVYAPNITINGNADKEVVKEATKQSYEEFVIFMNRYVKENKRTRF